MGFERVGEYAPQECRARLHLPIERGAVDPVAFSSMLIFFVGSAASPSFVSHTIASHRIANAVQCGADSYTGTHSHAHTHRATHGALTLVRRRTGSHGGANR